MKRTVCFLGLALAAFSGCRSSSAVQSLKTLRVIKIEQHTLLTLGAEIPESTGVCNWRGDTCTFKPGTFGGAKAMSLSKTDSELISQFHFDYGTISAEAVNAQIEDYIRTLGKPSRDSTQKKGNIDIREVEWSDSATSFQLIYKTREMQVEASATLFDRALAEPGHE